MCTSAIFQTCSIWPCCYVSTWITTIIIRLVKDEFGRTPPDAWTATGEKLVTKGCRSNRCSNERLSRSTRKLWAIKRKVNKTSANKQSRVKAKERNMLRPETVRLKTHKKKEEEIKRKRRVQGCGRINAPYARRMMMMRTILRLRSGAAHSEYIC